MKKEMNLRMKMKKKKDQEEEEEEAYIATPVSRSIFFMMRLPQSAHEFMGMNSPLETPH